MKMTTALLGSLICISLLSGTATAQPGRVAHPATSSHQRLHTDMMGGDMDMGMGRGMMGGFMMSIMSPDQQQFLDATRDLRRQMLKLRFDYLETMRAPKATPAETWPESRAGCSISASR